MNLSRYIRGERKGEEARDVELEILRDSFLSDAISGFDASGAGQEFAKDIAELRKEIVSKMLIKRRRWVLWLVIIVIVCVGAVLAFILLSDKEVGMKPSTLPVKTLKDSGQTAVMVATEHNKDVGSGSEFKETVSIETEKDSAVSEAQTKPMQVDKVEIKADVKPTEIADHSSMSAKPYTGTSLISIHTMDPSDSTSFLTVPSTGLKKYNEYLSKARVLPTESERGDVTVSFKVNQYGRPSTIRVESSPSKEANKEAIRLLNSGPEWHPTEERVSVTICLR